MTSKLIGLAAAAGIGIAALIQAPPASAQATLTLDGGQACTYGSYTKTVTASGLPMFNFTGVSGNCRQIVTGGGQSLKGTARFEATTAPNSDTGGPPKSININRDGHVPGGGHTIYGTVSVNTTFTTAACAIANNSGTFTMPEGTTLTTISVNPGNTPGSCVLDLTADALGSITRMNFQVVNPNAAGTLQFALPTSQNANPGQTVSVSASRTGAGGSTSASATYSCSVTAATPPGSYTFAVTDNYLFFPGETTKSAQLALPAFGGSTTSATVTCTIVGVGGNPAGPSVAAGTSHVITVAPIAPAACAPTASPASTLQGTAATISLTSNCTGGTISGWEWEAVTANAPALSATNVQNPTVAVLTSTAAGTYTYRVRANNGSFGNFAPVNVTVGTITAPTCAPSASPGTINQGTAATVNLTSNCTGGTVNGWEWEAVTANAPTLSATNAQNPTVSVLTTTPNGSYVYRVRGSNGALGAFANVTVTVQTQIAGCTVRTIDEFPSWAPSPNGTGDTTNSPVVSINPGDTLSFKLPYNQNYAFVPRDNTPTPPAGTFWGFFVNPTGNQAGVNYTGQVIAYLAVGGPYVLSVSDTPCSFVGHTVNGQGTGSASITLTEARNGRCTRVVEAQGSLMFHRNDSTVTNTQFDGTSGQACRLPLPDAQGFLYVNMKPIGPPSATPAGGCTSGYCVQMLHRND